VQTFELWLDLPQLGSTPLRDLIGGTYVIASLTGLEFPIYPALPIAIQDILTPSIDWSSADHPFVIS
jgi:hypothetical protein